jgi:hypothetical protein
MTTLIGKDFELEIYSLLDYKINGDILIIELYHNTKNI